jgi:hypothetical protein
MRTVSNSLATIKRNTDNSLGLFTNHFDLIKPGSLYRNPLTTSDVDLGDVPLWPAKAIVINSDVPVKFTIQYPEESFSQGNTLYKTQHLLQNAVPLDYNTTVKLTDSAGAVYVSPVQRYSRDAGCAQAVVNFSGGQFTWQ